LKELKARKLSFREKLMNDIKIMSEIMTMKINSMYESLNEETKYIDDEIDQTEAKLNNQVSKLHSLEKMIKDDSREIVEDTNIDIDENIFNLSLKSFEQACLKLNQFNKTSKELKENSIENNSNCEYSVNLLNTVC
jgi:phosphate uptake regulator